MTPTVDVDGGEDASEETTRILVHNESRDMLKIQIRQIVAEVLLIFPRASKLEVVLSVNFFFRSSPFFLFLSSFHVSVSEIYMLSLRTSLMS